MLTRALERSFPLLVVPSKALRKFAFGSGMCLTLPPRTTRPAMEMLGIGVLVVMESLIVVGGILTRQE